MTHDCCLMPDCQGCVVLADSNNDTPQSFTCHWPSILAILLSWNQPTELPYHMSMSHVANRLHDDWQCGDCEMSGDINRLLMFTVDCTGVAILSSQCAGDSDTCADPHLHHRLVRSTSQTGLSGTRQTGHTGHYAMCWAGLGRWQRAAVYISQYALFPSSPLGIRYNTAFWITYDNFIACKRRVNRVIRIFIGSATTYMNNNETLFFSWGLHVYCLHCTFENGANQTTIICTLTIFLWKIIYFVRLYFIQLFAAIVHWMCIHH